MQLNKYFFALIVSFCLGGCIENYNPKDIVDYPNNYVVYGRVTDDSDYHLIQVSQTSSLNDPQLHPVLSCEVIIVDSNNNIFTTDSTTRSGEYYVKINRSLISPGNAYKVEVHTPSGVIIESAFDTLRPCPDIQDINYKRVDKPTHNPDSPERGVQFTIDVIANNSYGRFYRWELEETFEYTADYPITFYYNGTVNTVLPEDFSLYYCWQTKPISDFFQLSTKHLANNTYHDFDLHFVNNRSQRLLHLYSILIYQSSIGEDQFNFLEQIRLNSQNQEGLFSTQPTGVVGNLTSPSHPDFIVHGFFSAEGRKSRRFFFKNTMDVPFQVYSNCNLMDLENGYNAFKPRDYPVYLVNDEGVMKWVYDFCVDCRELGGTTEAPDYWP
ncbi:MAG: DUF4249 family protein [Candidatus Moranbacteria bacterium]|jgi:hypothetical protein|nr:DUF4249 family protein [Candidatus Moranbacteria bacterium]